MQTRTTGIKSRLSRCAVMTLVTLTCLLVVAGAWGAGVLRNRPVRALQERPSEKPVEGVSLDHLVPVGIQVAVSQLALVSEPSASPKGGKTVSGPAQLKFRLQPQGSEKLTSVNLALFEYGENGALRAVNGWVRQQELSDPGGAEFTLDLERRVAPGARLVLAVERGNSRETTRDTAFTDLARAGNAKAVGRPFIIPASKSSASAMPDDSGSALCANALRRAMSLAQSGDKAGVTSFTCDQHNRTFTFTFNGKNLLN